MTIHPFLYHILDVKGRNIGILDIENLYFRNTLNYYQISEKDIKGKSRKRPLPEARAIISFIFVSLLRMNTTYTGRFIGKDHSTVVVANQKIISFLKIGDIRTIEALESILSQDDFHKVKSKYYTPLKKRIS